MWRVFCFGQIYQTLYKLGHHESAEKTRTEAESLINEITQEINGNEN
jgi:hypothetical protein